MSGAVIVVSYGSSGLLRENLPPLSASGARIVVVDNFSSTHERLLVTELARRHGWELVLRDNRGFGAGVNAGAGRAVELGCDTLLLLNPDVTVTPAVVAALLRQAGDDRDALVTPALTRPDGTPVVTEGTLDLARGTTRSRVLDPTLEPWLTGACLALSVDLWQRVGGLAEDYFMYWEDLELSVRCRRAGGRLVVRRDLRAVHAVGGTQGSGKSPLYRYYNCRNRLLFAHRNVPRRQLAGWLAATPRYTLRVMLRDGARSLARRPVATALPAVRGSLAGLRCLVLARSSSTTAAAINGTVGTGPRSLIVLQSLPGVRSTTNPYLVQLLQSLPEPVRVEFFDWRTALLGRYDVLHVHWPEILLRGSSRVRTAARRACFALLMLRVATGGPRLVRTLHNTAPHETRSAVERLLLRWCDRVTHRWIRLNPRTTPPTAAPVDTILHGHYRDWYAAHEVPAPVPGRLLFFGLVRPYKGVEALVDAVRASADSALSLRVVGKPSSAGLERLLRAASRADPRITAVLEYVDEAALAREIGGATLVVLPYRDLHNSGSLLLALSVGRPVLVPDNDVTRDLAREFGDAWVHRFTGDLEAADLIRALTAAEGARSDTPPDMSTRSWEDIGRRHAATYRAAVRAPGTRLH